MSASLPAFRAARSGAPAPDHCPLCGGLNHCQLGSPAPAAGTCWCMKVNVPADLLALLPAEQRHQACVCRNCVTHFAAARPPGNSLALRPEDFYFESGRMIFTAAYLRRRGYCCGNGCRHCPYPERTGGA